MKKIFASLILFLAAGCGAQVRTIYHDTLDNFRDVDALIDQDYSARVDRGDATDRICAENGTDCIALSREERQHVLALIPDVGEMDQATWQARPEQQGTIILDRDGSRHYLSKRASAAIYDVLTRYEGSGSCRAARETGMLIACLSLEPEVADSVFSLFNPGEFSLTSSDGDDFEMILENSRGDMLIASEAAIDTLEGLALAYDARARFLADEKQTFYAEILAKMVTTADFSVDYIWAWPVHYHVDDGPIGQTAIQLTYTSYGKSIRFHVLGSLSNDTKNQNWDYENISADVSLAQLDAQFGQRKKFHDFNLGFGFTKRLFSVYWFADKSPWYQLGIELYTGPGVFAMTEIDVGDLSASVYVGTTEDATKDGIKETEAIILRGIPKGFDGKLRFTSMSFLTLRASIVRGGMFFFHNRSATYYGAYLGVHVPFGEWFYSP